MMRRSFIQLFCSTAILVGFATSVAGQNPDQVDDIVQQALNLARGAQESQESRTAAANPFAASMQNDNQIVQTPGVDIQDSEIRIKVGDQEIVVPRNVGASSHTSASSVRINGQPLPPPGDPALNIDPSGNVTVKHGDNMVSTLAWQEFAMGIEAFSSSDYSNAVRHFDASVKVNPNDTTPHPFLSLALFAVGEYDRSAEYAYSAAANSKKWNWEELRSYYGQIEDYKSQYEQLQVAVRQPNASVSAHFLLGWHHLMLGHRDASAREFELVSSQLPDDAVVQHWLSVARQPIELPPAPLR